MCSWWFTVDLLDLRSNFSMFCMNSHTTFLSSLDSRSSSCSHRPRWISSYPLNFRSSHSLWNDFSFFIRAQQLPCARDWWIFMDYRSEPPRFSVLLMGVYSNSGLHGLFVIRIDGRFSCRLPWISWVGNVLQGPTLIVASTFIIWFGCSQIFVNFQNLHRPTLFGLANYFFAWTSMKFVEWQAFSSIVRRTEGGVQEEEGVWWQRCGDTGYSRFKPWSNSPWAW